MSDAEDIMALGNTLDENIKFTLDACEDLVQVPKMFRKMALKTILKGARTAGVTVIDREFALKYKP
jgi:hypothetical protein